MSECCSNCRNRLHGIKTDFGKLGTDQDIDTPMEGYICLALAFEGIAYWVVNHDESKGMCEMYRPMAERKTEPQTDCADTNLSGKPTDSTRSKMEQVGKTEPQTERDAQVIEMALNNCEALNGGCKNCDTDCAWKRGEE